MKILRVEHVRETGHGILYFDGDPDGVYTAPTGMHGVDRVSGSLWLKTPDTTTSWAKAGVGTYVALELQFGDGQSNIVSGNRGRKMAPLRYKTKIKRVNLWSPDTGSGVLDIWARAFPLAPAVGNSICGGSKPTIVAGSSYDDSTLTGWSPTIDADKTWVFNWDSISSFTEIYVSLLLERV